MPVERTLCIVKPDAVEKRKAGAILAKHRGGRLHDRRLEAPAPHRTGGRGLLRRAQGPRRFFGELVQFMTRSPVVVAVLEREDAVAAWRAVMGATDPAKAAPGTIRKLFGSNVGENATHGSDSLENAQIEIAYFFPASEVATRA